MTTCEYRDLLWLNLFVLTREIIKDYDDPSPDHLDKLIKEFMRTIPKDELLAKVNNEDMRTQIAQDYIVLDDTTKPIILS
jgi:arylamine N-acetyltransferase